MVYNHQMMELKCNTENTRTGLFKKITDLPLDQGKTRGFSSQLRQDYGWSRHYTQRAIEEYRRFLWIAATSGQEVTPSKVVDQIWHLHILHTRSYYDDLCRDMLGYVLHHNPGDGSAADERFPENYRATLALYEAAFGPPPADIWPRPHVPARRAPSSNRLAVVTAALVPATIFSTPVDAATAATGKSLAVTMIALAVIVFGFMLSLMIYKSLRAAPRNSRKSSGDGGFGISGLLSGDTGCDDGGASDCAASCGSCCGS